MNTLITATIAVGFLAASQVTAFAGDDLASRPRRRPRRRVKASR